ncbi:hypothetical protein [Candidatus Poriferisodalis sp.]|uniref:hypothetical protein n=1 Tax=Candidatus Poriferisodalis sp. TaxID=3101277 RepID=UPI003B014E4A
MTLMDHASASFMSLKQEPTSIRAGLRACEASDPTRRISEQPPALGAAGGLVGVLAGLAGVMGVLGVAGAPTVRVVAGAGRRGDTMCLIIDKYVS